MVEFGVATTMARFEQVIEKFYILKASDTQSFFIQRNEQNCVIWRHNGIDVVFEIVERTSSHWCLRDANQNVHKVAVAKLGNQLSAKLGAKTLHFDMWTEKSWRRKSAVSDSSANSANVMAPMPGRIVKIEVCEGDTVQVGQGLIVVEAMKMENEFKALKQGVVKKIHVNVGDAVEAKTLLMEIV